MLQKIKPKKFKLGIVGGGPGSWIGHVHRISSRYDDKYEIVAGVFSRSVDKSRKFGQSIGLDKSRCYSNYKEMSEKEAKRKARIEQRRARRSSVNPKGSEQETMHDINKPITLEDLTNPDKN